MKKIMFDDQYGLTQAVLEGRKTQTRRMFTAKRGTDVQVVHSKGLDKDGNPSNQDDILVFLTHPLVENKVTIDGVTYDNFVKFVYPNHHIGDILAIAQSYKDVNYVKPYGPEKVSELIKSSGWNNKMFVKAELMPHHIKITDVRLEQVKDISDEDCIKEGIRLLNHEEVKQGIAPAIYTIGSSDKFQYYSPRNAFFGLCCQLKLPRPAWVVVYDFELVD